MARGQCWWRPGPVRFHVPWVTTLRDRNDLPLLSAEDLTSEMLTELSVIAVPVVAEKRLTFPRTLPDAQDHGLRSPVPDQVGHSRSDRHLTRWYGGRAAPRPGNPQLRHSGIHAARRAHGQRLRAVLQ